LSSLVLAGLLLAAAPTGSLMAKGAKSPAKTHGVIMERSPDLLTVRDHQGKEVFIKLLQDTQIEELKKNFLRDPKVYSRRELIPGLDVFVKGTQEEGWILANEVKFTQDALKVARAIFSKVTPIEEGLDETHAMLRAVNTRINRQEGKGEQLSGDVDELQAGLKLTRTQLFETDGATQRSLRAIESTNERISSMDSYQIFEMVAVSFPFNSSQLPTEELTKLDGLIEKAVQQSGYIVEVRGFASSDGNAAYNRRLSQKRADSVRSYLVETQQVPLRRLVNPFGYGSTHPVADNSTLEGRKKNRRVEVRILINEGLMVESPGMRASMTTANPFR